MSSATRVDSSPARRSGGRRIRTALRSHGDRETYTDCVLRFTIDVVPAPLIYYRTRSTAVRNASPLTRRALSVCNAEWCRTCWVNEELTPEERIIMRECLSASLNLSAGPEPRRANDEVLEWAHRELDGASAWDEAGARAQDVARERNGKGAAHMLAEVDPPISRRSAPRPTFVRHARRFEPGRSHADVEAGEREVLRGAGRLLARLAGGSTGVDQLRTQARAARGDQYRQRRRWPWRPFRQAHGSDPPRAGGPRRRTRVLPGVLPPRSAGAAGRGGPLSRTTSRSREGGCAACTSARPGEARAGRARRDLDVIVDIRPGHQFGEWEAFRLDDAEGDHRHVPDGFAMGSACCPSCPT